MRIDFVKAYEYADCEKAKMKIEGLKMDHWKAFGELIKEEVSEQMSLF